MELQIDPDKKEAGLTLYFVISFSKEDMGFLSAEAAAAAGCCSTSAIQREISCGGVRVQGEEGRWIRCEI